MSVQLIAWAYEQETGNITRKAVLLALANRANHDTGRCDPSVTRIAKEIEASPSTVKKALKELAEMGLIEIVRRKREDGSDRSNAYRFPAAGGGAERRRGEGATADPPRGRETTPNQKLEPEGEPEVEPSTAVAAAAPYDPLKGRRIDGRDLPWDALAEATQAYGKANGARMKSALASIREDVVAENGAERTLALIDHWGWERYEEALAAEITRRAESLKTRSPGLTWGPEGIAKNWRTVQNKRSTESIVAEVMRGAA